MNRDIKVDKEGNLTIVVLSFILIACVGFFAIRWFMNIAYTKEVDVWLPPVYTLDKQIHQVSMSTPITPPGICVTFDDFKKIPSLTPVQITITQGEEGVLVRYIKEKDGIKFVAYNSTRSEGLNHIEIMADDKIVLSGRYHAAGSMFSGFFILIVILSFIVM